MEDRLMEAGKKKEEGNVLYKSGKYQRAGKKYDKVSSPVLFLHLYVLGNF